jgi:putative ABC transport system permease protein
MDSILRDLRFGFRQLRSNPTFTLVAVLSLALGVGANTAVFQLIDAIRLQPLPVENPRELALLDFAKNSQRSGNWSTRSARFTYALWEEIRKRQDAFTGVMSWSATRFNLSAGGEARYAEGLFVSANFFSLAGVHPALGRTFAAEDDVAGCGSPGAVISNAFWQREFAGDPGVIGRTVRLDGHPFPIIGVTPPSFFGVEVGHRFDVAIALCADPLFSDDGKGRIPVTRAWWLSIMGRLKPGWMIERAQARFAILAPGIMEATLPSSYIPPDARRYLGNKLTVTQGATGVSNLRSYYENPLWLLLATTGLVLLIACANLANLLLARASVRERELAVRQAIGASRGRLVSQLLSESLLLAIFGTALGALLARALSRGLVAFLSTSNNPAFVDLSFNWQMLGFMAAIAIGTCLLFGLAPALRATRVAPSAAMRSGSRGLSDGRERLSLRRVLVVAQVSLSLVLLVGALLFVGSLKKLMQVDAGFRPEGVVSIDVDLRPAHYSRERLPGIYRALLERIQARSGAISAAQVGWAPVSGSSWDDTTWADGSNMAHLDCYYNVAGPGYFKTMGTALVAGRDFDERDRVGAPRVAIVTEVFAQKIFGARNPVGLSFRVQASAGKPDDVFQVVGLVRNTKYHDLREDFPPVAILPVAQRTEPGMGATFVLRTNAPLADVFRGAAAGIAEVHPAIGIQFSVLTDQLKDSLMRDRLMAALAGAFAVLAGLLAVLGLYGVIAYMVTRRRNEIGVRIALGANRRRIVGLVLGEAVWLVAIGLAAGAGLALWAGRATGAMLYGLKPYDPPTLAGAMALLAAVALLASYVPARRAARMEPMNALRQE